MRGRRLWVLAGCFCAMVLGSSAARAEGGGTIESGTITFVGAIVASTCNPVTSDSIGAATTTQAPKFGEQRQTCAGPGGDAANAARVYAKSVTHLSSSEPDRVLKYFSDYVRADANGSADPVLLTQTYE